MQHILISRTDAIGDVVLTLPVCGLIKKYMPGVKVSFLGNSYTREIITASVFVDDFINYDDWVGDDEKAVRQLVDMQIDTIIHVFPKNKIAYLALKAGIDNRVGTTNRIYHWLYCNKLVKLSRKNSYLHESQLNIKLLEGIGIDVNLDLKDIPQYFGLNSLSLPSELDEMLAKDKFNLIIHPKSRGSSKEWSLERYAELINMIDLNHFKIFISGSQKEKAILSEWVKGFEGRVTDLTGKFSLRELLHFIAKADGLIAASTGPVHLAAALGINALGLYPNSASINARRWGPIGQKASFIQAETGNINQIGADKVMYIVTQWK